MRTYEEYRRILELWEARENKKAISRITGIPRATVRDCIWRFASVRELEINKDSASKSTPDEVLRRIQDSDNTGVQSAYAYLLGMYLGDGYIVQNKRVYFLRISLDNSYPQIIQRCVDNIQIILPENKVNVLKMKGGNWVEVICTHKFWPEIIPQHGSGYKHTRAIKLEPWQQLIVETYRLEFFRGLYHSDGCRERNFVNGKNYPRYSFSNASADIQRLFIMTCEMLGLHWTVATNGRSINIAKRKDVEYLDSLIGPKS